MMKAETSHYVSGIDPGADAYSATVTSDIVNLKNWNHVEFILFNGVGTTGTSTITVEASDDVSATNVSAVAFYYRRILGSTNVPGALTASASTGFTTTAGSAQIYVVEIDTEKLVASGYGFVRLKAVEVADSPVLGGILIRLSEGRFALPIADAAIA